MALNLTPAGPVYQTAVRLTPAGQSAYLLVSWVIYLQLYFPQSRPVNVNARRIRSTNDGNGCEYLIEYSIILALIPGPIVFRKITSHVLTETSRSYRKAKNSTPHRMETPNLIGIKFGTVDYVGEVTPGVKFHANPSRGLLGKWVKYTQRFLFIYTYTFFRNLPTGQIPRRISARDGANDAVSRKGVPFGG